MQEDYVRLRTVVAVSAGIAIAVLAGAASCGDNPSPSQPSRPPVTVEGQTPSPSPSVGRPAETKPPVPRAFPVLTEEAGVQRYVATMVNIHVAALKNRQPHEVVPRVVPISGAADCREWPDGKASKIGDKAKPTSKPIKTETLAPCLHEGKLAVYYAPASLYQQWRADGRATVEQQFYLVMRDYFALLTQNLIGDYSRAVNACAGGRLAGGLRDNGYIGVQRANAIQAPLGDTAGLLALVYSRARDSGYCDPRLLGVRGSGR